MTVSARQFGHLFDPGKGGFSVNTQTGESPNSGYMVALTGFRALAPLCDDPPLRTSTSIGRRTVSG